MPRWAKENVIFRFCQSLPPANEVWGKVMFSQACVITSVHGGGSWLSSIHHRSHDWGVCIQVGSASRQVWFQGGLVQGVGQTPLSQRDTWDTMGYGQHMGSMLLADTLSRCPSRSLQGFLNWIYVWITLPSIRAGWRSLETPAARTSS